MGIWDYLILIAVIALVIVIIVNYFRHKDEETGVHCGSCPYKKYCPDPKGRYVRKTKGSDAGDE